MTTLLILLMLLGCAEAPVAPPAPAPAAPAPVPAIPLPDVVLSDVHTDVLELPELQAIESSGWSFGALVARLGATPAPASVHPSLQTLAEGPVWHAVSARLTDDIDTISAGMDWALVTDHRNAVKWPGSNVGRAFNTAWLRSPIAHLRLAGVVQRIDRQDLMPTPGCGEVRFVYRLAYTTALEDGGVVGSRLPFTVNAVYIPQETDCRAWARRWEAAPSSAGVLDPSGLRFDRFEVNAQVVRFPAGVSTELGGQAAYLLEVLDVVDTPEGRVAQRRPLENTPDVQKISADPALRAQLIDWINANTAAIDEGTHILPTPMLADQALSWSTSGINRLANHPFSALFPPGGRKGLAPPTGDLSLVASVAGVLDRLDNSTCIGCHQAGSTAGFHLLGPDDPTLAGLTNRLATPLSPHFAEERFRRRDRTRDLANGQPPRRHRPHSLAPNFAMKGYIDVIGDQPCLPERHQADLQPQAQWGCEGETRCAVAVDDPLVAINWGQCQPVSVDALTPGMACRAGTLASQAQRRPAPAGLPWNQRAHWDKLTQSQRYDLPEDKRFTADQLNCRPPVLGVPLGRAYRSCTPEERALTGVLGDTGSLTPAICAVVGGSSFDACVEGNFHTCLAQTVGRGMVATCGPDRACREDHACQALPWQLDGIPSEAGKALTDAGIGFCTPTYFLFQLRLDGHPQP